MAKNGRSRPRLHVQWGPSYSRDQKVCVTNPVSDEDCVKIADAIQQFLEQTLPEPGRKKASSAQSHTALVRFVLGKDNVDLGIQTLPISLQNMRDGHTTTLFERIAEARSVACLELGLPLEPDKEAAA